MGDRDTFYVTLSVLGVVMWGGHSAAGEMKGVGGRAPMGDDKGPGQGAGGRCQG